MQVLQFACSLNAIDQKVRTTASQITNVSLDENQWKQASLPVQHGGLGLRSITQLSLPCHISSMHQTLPLTRKILNSPDLQPTSLTEAESQFLSMYPGSQAPSEDKASSQRQWDELANNKEFSNLINSANQVHSARLLAAASPHTGAWLQALPSSALGLHLDRETIRINVALRLGATVCEPHQCRCSKFVDSLGHHGLSCKKSAGRLPRHSNLNDVVKRSLNSMGTPSRLEPVGLDRGDGKRPDGITTFPFSGGKYLCWDSTCGDTFAPSIIHESATKAGSAANKAEERKRQHYQNLETRYRFEPLAFETTGVYGKSTAKLVSEIGRKITGATGDKRETHWLRQRISVAIARGNAASVLNTGLES